MKSDKEEKGNKKVEIGEEIGAREEKEEEERGSEQRKIGNKRKEN